MHGWPKGWLGLELAAWFGGAAARGTGTTRVLVAGGKVLPVSSWGPQGGRRARLSGVELTRVAAWRRGGGGCFGRQRSTVARQLRWPMVA
jgi:hypothetical protein